MTPYYDQNGITIYCGDNRKIAPLLGQFDLLLTDPPYGIGAGQMNFGMWVTSKMPKTDWDEATPERWHLEMMITQATASIIWGMNYFQLPPSRHYLVWDKGAGFKGRDFAECEIAWCSWDANAKVFERDPLAAGDYRGKVHPTQKPEALMSWCLSHAPDAKTVLDPWMGSGTTLVAAKLRGLRATGIEINEDYCRAAVNRLAQEVLAL